MADKQLTVAELMARAQKENPDAQPRRRRRRSLDEGGISVAELTGSLRTVDARPAEVKHSNAPIDAEHTDRKQPVKEQAPKKPEQPKPEQPKPEQPKPEQPAVKVIKVEKPVDKPASKPEVKQVKTEPVKTEPAKPEVKKVAPVPAEAKPVVDKRDVPSREDAEETNVIPVVKDKPLSHPATEPQDAVERDAAEAEYETHEAHEDYEDAEGEYEYVYDEDEVDDGRVNPVMLVLLVFAGLLVGVIVFLGFQYLWSTLNRIVVALLALAATAGIVLLVRGMKTGRDGLTTTLAAIAGAVMTFGPALVTGF